MYSPNRLILAFCLVLTMSLSTWAATPSSGTITTPANDTLGTKQTLNFFGGPLVASTAVGTSPVNVLAACLQAVQPPTGCDQFSLKLETPTDYFRTRAGNITVRLTWTTDLGQDPSENDVDLYIVDDKDKVVGSGTSSNTSTHQALEVAMAINPSPRTYRVIIVNWLSTAPIPRYDATVTFNLTPLPTAAPPTARVFDNHVPPAPLGRDSLEPTIGANWKTGNVMYQSGLETLRVSFDDTVKPAQARWDSVGATLTSVETLDPILYTDLGTGRTFVSQLYAACSLLAFTDDDGASWIQNPVGCGLAAAVDHQTVGGGPWAAGMQSVDPVFNYKNSVWYCAQGVAAAMCGNSINGGLTWNPALPMYNITQCQGLHGHIEVANDGTLYVPNASCGNNESGVAVSEDNGLSWRISTVPGSTGGSSDPYVDTAPDGTVYFAWSDGNGHAYTSVSTDKGVSWSAPFDVGAAVGVQNSVFPTIVAGDPDRAAIAFIGTQLEGDYQSSTFPGTWYLYAAFTYDKGKTWTTYDASNGDPVQRGCIWNGGGSNPCRNLLDFFGITLDKQGRVLVGYADGCIDDPSNPARQCVSNPPADVRDTPRSKLATIARQSAGLPLFAEHDGLPATAPGAPSLSGLAGNRVNHLNWSVPSNGGAAISSYKVYRGTSAGSLAPFKTVTGTVTSYDDTEVSNDATYFYRVSAVNSVGEGTGSNVLELTPKFSAAPSAPQRLKATGKQGGVLVMWSAPKSAGTAPVTNYKVYRGTASGNLALLTTVDNVNRYVDGATQSGTRYFYQVSAVNSVGEGPRSNEDSAEAK